jgi:flavin-dependent dehydrogenase
MGMQLRPDRRDVELRAADGEVTTIGARLVVGADGAYSVVRKALDPQSPRDSKKHTSLALRAYAASSDFAPGGRIGPRLMFEFSRELLPSYGWVFPADGGRVNVGVGGPIEVLQNRGVDLKAQLADFAAQIRDRGIELGELEDQRGHQLPHIAGLAKLSHPRAVLIGDAASMINPVSGEGIAYAVTSAAQLANALPPPPVWPTRPFCRRPWTASRRTSAAGTAPTSCPAGSAFGCCATRHGPESCSTPRAGTRKC